MRRPFGTVSALFVSLVLWQAEAAHAQPVALDEAAEAPNSTRADKIGFGNGSFILAPIPFRNESLGAGVAIGGAYLFKDRAGARTSNLGFGYFKTENGSEGFGASLDLSLGFRGWRRQLLVGDLDLNYDLFIGGIPVPLRQSATGVQLKLSKDVSEDVTTGVGLTYAESEIELDALGFLPDVLQPDAELELGKLALSAAFDTRDDTDYPTEGWYTTGDLSFGYLRGTGGRSYAKGIVSVAQYINPFRDGVFAWNVTGCSVNENAPFFDACSLGGADNFRGYSATQFIDDALLSVQAEYRGRIPKIVGGRLGYVVFAGAGTTGDRLDNALTGDFKSAVGIGARIRLSQAFPIDYAVDVSYNDAGESILYVTLGQRF